MPRCSRGANPFPDARPPTFCYVGIEVNGQLKLENDALKTLDMSTSGTWCPVSSIPSTSGCDRHCHGGQIRRKHKCLFCGCINCGQCAADGGRAAKQVRNERVNHSVTSFHNLKKRRQHTAAQAAKTRRERRNERLLNSYSQTAHGEKVVTNKLRLETRFNANKTCPASAGDFGGLSRWLRRRGSAPSAAVLAIAPTAGAWREAPASSLTAYSCADLMRKDTAWSEECGRGGAAGARRSTPTAADGLRSLAWWSGGAFTAAPTLRRLLTLTAKRRILVTGDSVGGYRYCALVCALARAGMPPIDSPAGKAYDGGAAGFGAACKTELRFSNGLVLGLAPLQRAIGFANVWAAAAEARTDGTAADDPPPLLLANAGGLHYHTPRANLSVAAAPDAYTASLDCVGAAVARMQRAAAGAGGAIVPTQPQHFPSADGSYDKWQQKKRDACAPQPKGTPPSWQQVAEAAAAARWRVPLLDVAASWAERWDAHPPHRTKKQGLDCSHPAPAPGVWDAELTALAQLLERSAAAQAAAAAGGGGAADGKKQGRRRRNKLSRLRTDAEARACDGVCAWTVRPHKDGELLIEREGISKLGGAKDLGSWMRAKEGGAAAREKAGRLW